MSHSYCETKRHLVRNKSTEAGLVYQEIVTSFRSRSQVVSTEPLSPLSLCSLQNSS